MLPVFPQQHRNQHELCPSTVATFLHHLGRMGEPSAAGCDRIPTIGESGAQTEKQHTLVYDRPHQNLGNDLVLAEMESTACGEKTQPNRNNLPFQVLRSDRLLAFGRLPVLTFGNPGSMVKVSYFTSEQIMSFILQPWQVVFVALSAWVNQRQQLIIEFQNAEIEALLKKLGKKRVLLTDDQRRLLAVQGKVLGRKALIELTTIVTPDTILR